MTRQSVCRRSLFRGTLAVCLGSILIIGGSADVRAAADAEEPWVGLWRLNSGLEGSDALHIVVSKTDGQYQVHYYTEGFGRRNEFDRSTVGPAGLRVESRRTSKPFAVELKLAAPGRAVGTWKLLHPQFQAETPFRGVQVNRNNSWQPADLAGLSDGLPVLNLVTELEKAPTGSVQEFERFWDEVIENRYYQLVFDRVYTPNLGRESRTERLRSIMQGIDSTVVARSRAIEQELQRIYAELTAKSVELNVKNTFIITPSPADITLGPVVLDGGLLMRLSPNLPEEKLRGILAFQKLQVPFYSIFPPATRAYAAIAMREGLAAQLAIQFGFADGPESMFPNWDPQKAQESLEVIVPRIRDAMRNPAAAKSLSHEAGVMVGMAFAKQLLAGYSLGELPNLPQQKMADLFWEFLRSH